MLARRMEDYNGLDISRSNIDPKFWLRRDIGVCVCVCVCVCEVVSVCKCVS